MLNVITSILNTANVLPPTANHSIEHEDFTTTLHAELTSVRKVLPPSALKGYNKDMDETPIETLTTKISTNDTGEKFLIMLANSSIIRQVALTEVPPPKPSINYTAARKAYNLDD